MSLLSQTMNYTEKKRSSLRLRGDKCRGHVVKLQQPHQPFSITDPRSLKATKVPSSKSRGPVDTQAGPPVLTASSWAGCWAHLPQELSSQLNCLCLNCLRRQFCWLVSSWFLSSLFFWLFLSSYFYCSQMSTIRGEKRKIEIGLGTFNEVIHAYNISNLEGKAGGFWAWSSPGAA